MFDIPQIIKDERLSKLTALTEPMQNCKLRHLRNLKFAYMQDVSLDGCEELWKLLEVQGKFIHRLSFDSYIKVEVLNKILRCTENLKELHFKELILMPDDYEQIDLKDLKHLKTLNAEACENIEFSKIKLPEDQLKVLNINARCYKKNFSEDLSQFLIDQKKLTSMKLPKSFGMLIKLTKNFLKNCKLEILEWSEFCEIDQNAMNILEEIFENQTNLKELKLLIPIWCTGFDKMTKSMTNLESFSGIFGENINEDIFWKIKQLKNLKNLNIINAHLDSIFGSETKNETEIESQNSNAENIAKKFKYDFSYFLPNLISLHLNECSFSSPKTAEYLAKSLPNLRVLKCSESELKFDFQELLLNFSQLESLELTEYCDLFREDSFKLDNSKITRNENLKTLRFHLPLSLETSNFKAFTDSYPNLMDFEIFIHNQEQKNFKIELKMIFENFKKIEKIFISFAYTCEIDFDIFEKINSIQNLKFLYIKNIGFSNEELKGKMDILKNKYEELKIISEGEYGIENCYAISIAKNYTIYLSKISNLEEFTELCTYNDQRISF